MTNRIRNARPDRLSLLLSLTDLPDDKFTEFSRICEEQLCLPIVPQLNDSATADRVKLQQIARSVVPPIRTFGDVLDRLDTPVELIIWAKDSAKISSQSLVSYVPAEVASMLYYAYMALALISHNVIISDLNLAELKRGLEWCLNQTWPNAKIIKLLRDGYALVLLKIRFDGHEVPSNY